MQQVSTWPEPANPAHLKATTQSHTVQNWEILNMMLNLTRIVWKLGTGPFRTKIYNIYWSGQKGQTPSVPTSQKMYNLSKQRVVPYPMWYWYSSPSLCLVRWISILLELKRLTLSFLICILCALQEKFHFCTLSLLFLIRGTCSWRSCVTTLWPKRHLVLVQIGLSGFTQIY